MNPWNWTVQVRKVLERTEVAMTRIRFFPIVRIGRTVYLTPARTPTENSTPPIGKGYVSVAYAIYDPD